MAYSVYLNGSLIRFGTVSLLDDLQEEIFSLEMKLKYMTEESDIVETIFE